MHVGDLLKQFQLLLIFTILVGYPLGVLILLFVVLLPDLVSIGLRQVLISQLVNDILDLLKVCVVQLL